MSLTNKVKAIENEIEDLDKLRDSIRKNSTDCSHLLKSTSDRKQKEDKQGQQLK